MNNLTSKLTCKSMQQSPINVYYSPSNSAPDQTFNIPSSHAHFATIIMIRRAILLKLFSSLPTWFQFWSKKENLTNSLKHSNWELYSGKRLSSRFWFLLFMHIYNSVFGNPAICMFKFYPPESKQCLKFSLLCLLSATCEPCSCVLE